MYDMSIFVSIVMLEIIIYLYYKLYQAHQIEPKTKYIYIDDSTGGLVESDTPPQPKNKWLYLLTGRDEINDRVYWLWTLIIPERNEDGHWFVGDDICIGAIHQDMPEGIRCFCDDNERLVEYFKMMFERDIEKARADDSNRTE